jgi:hypothetical protein
MQHIFKKHFAEHFLSTLAFGLCRYLSKGVLQSSKSAPTSLEVTLGRFESFSDEVTGLATGESAEPTGAVGLADLEESAWSTIAIG